MWPGWPPRSAGWPTLPGMVSVFMRPNPAVDWRPFNDPVYDPIWQAASDTGLPIALHPFLAPDLPGACKGLRLARPREAGRQLRRRFRPGPRRITTDEQLEHPEQRPSSLFTQAIANPVDVMSCIAYLLAGGVCERFPEAKFIFLEANGGWLVPWLERLDHHCRKFQWEVTDLSMLPSEYMKRQCWISFDPDEAMLRTTAESPLVGADRIIWASDYPHPDAKFPGVTEELAEALDGLTFEQKRQITSESRHRPVRDRLARPVPGSVPLEPGPAQAHAVDAQRPAPPGRDPAGPRRNTIRGRTERDEARGIDWRPGRRREVNPRSRTRLPFRI